MRLSGKFTILCMAALTLAGCAGGMPWDKKKTYKANVAPVTITDKSAAVSMDSGAQVYPLNGTELKSMVSASSGGSVEVYNLDNGRPYGGSGETISREPLGATPFDGGGSTLPSDPSVTVYPLDGGSDLYAALPQAGGYMPVPGQPMGGDMGLYNMGGGSSMDGGKNAARTGGPVSSVYFGYGSSSITGEDRNALRSVAETAKFAPVDRVLVEGHASTQTQTDDPVEARILNLRESLKRAGTVAEKLIEDGVPAEKIKTVGWGDTKQGSGSESDQRRVDIVTAPGAGF